MQQTQDTRVGLSWRSITVDDAPAWAALLAAVEAVDATGENYGLDDLLEELEDPDLDAARDTVAAFDENGVMVAYGLVRGASTVRAVDRQHVEGCVHPDHRRRGLGREVFERTAVLAADSHRRRHPDVPGELVMRTHDGNAGSAAIAAAAGLAPIRYWYDMARDVHPLPEPGPLADGLRVVPFDPAMDDAVRRAHNEAFGDHWGSVDRDAASWAQWFTGSRSFRPEVSLLVLDGTEIAGYLLSYEYDADVAVTGIREAWIGQIGTRRAWRGRGIGTAMLTRVIAAYAEAGIVRAALGVDTANPTGALGLYERAGFTPTECWTSHARPL